MSEQRKSKIAPAKRDAEGKCIDARCTRMGWSADGDMGRCVGWHCPYCDSPCSSHGHNCPNAPDDTLRILAVGGDDQ